jgi:hypothetical protein
MPKAVYLEWEDHNATHRIGGAWVDLTIVENKPSAITSIGFIVKEDADYVTIASCVDVDDPDIAKGVSTIIKSCITKRKAIKL